MSSPDHIKLDLIETRVEMNDSKYDILGLLEPQQIKYLNLSPVWTKLDIGKKEFTINFLISTDIQI